MQAFQQPQIWPIPYNYQPPSTGEDLGSSGWLDILNHLPSNGPIITSVISRDASPIPSPAIQDSVPLEENGLNSFDKHHDVLDEREDMIIERSLVAEEKQQSYAAALKEKQMASGDPFYNFDYCHINLCEVIPFNTVSQDNVMHQKKRLSTGP